MEQIRTGLGTSDSVVHFSSSSVVQMPNRRSTTSSKTSIPSWFSWQTTYMESLGFRSSSPRGEVILAGYWNQDEAVVSTFCFSSCGACIQLQCGSQIWIPQQFTAKTRVKGFWKARWVRAWVWIFRLVWCKFFPMLLLSLFLQYVCQALLDWRNPFKIHHFHPWPSKVAL